jgi:RHS repeat-associated protein
MGFYATQPATSGATTARPLRPTRPPQLGSRKPHRGPTSNRILSSKYPDRESYLYYYGERYYTPSAGVWTTRDQAEILVDGGALYAFCRGAPTCKLDAFGLLARDTDGWLSASASVTGHGRDEALMEVVLEATIDGPPNCVVVIDAQIRRPPAFYSAWNALAIYWRAVHGHAAPNSPTPPPGLWFPNIWLAFDFDAPSNYIDYSQQREERAILSLSGTQALGSPPIATSVSGPDAVYQWAPLFPVTPSRTPAWLNQRVDWIRLHEPLVVPLADCRCPATGDMEVHLWYGDSEEIASRSRGIGRHASFASWHLLWAYSPPSSMSICLRHQGQTLIPVDHRRRFGEAGTEWAGLPGRTSRSPWGP